MSTLLHLSSARAPTTSGSSGPTGLLHSLGAPLVLVIILAVLIGIMAIGAVFRTASTALAVITQPAMAMFRLLIAALVVIVVLVALLVSQPADANNRQPAPAPTSTTTPASAHHR
ncbi:MAG TPA: hypothetical protein VH373_14905 [Jatrophihabitantaceae bacterium]|jgi:hypothetical protein